MNPRVALHPPSHRRRASDDGADYPGSEYTPEQVEFMLAMDRYKRQNHRPNPTWAEVLAVAKSLGYRKVT